MAAASRRNDGSGSFGEVLEREIEDVLREAFPSDAIERVKAGKRGADVLQRVRSGRGECGTLLWESKNHKHWSDARSSSYVTNAVVAALTMKRELDAERTAAERAYKKREKQIEVQLRSLAGIYGGLQGIAGGALQPVAALEAPAGEDESEPLALAS